MDGRQDGRPQIGGGVSILLSSNVSSSPLPCHSGGMCDSCASCAGIERVDITSHVLAVLRALQVWRGLRVERVVHGRGSGRGGMV